MSSRCMTFLLSLGLLTSVSLPAVRAELPPLIPRKVLFGNPAREGYHLSPDGTRLSYIAPSEKGVANVWVQKLGDNSARMVTHDTHRGINAYRWAADGRHILYRQDLNGDENWHIYSTDLERPLVRDLTPFLGVRAQGVVTSSKRPNEILVDLNLRDKRVFDVYRVNLDTGAVVVEAENPGDVMSWTTDEEFVVRACTAFGGDDAHTTVRVRDDAKSPWRDVVTVPFTDCCFYGQVNGGSLIAGFAADGKSLYIVDCLHGDKTRLVEIDAQTGKELREIASDPKSDVEYNADLVTFTPMVMRDPKSGRVQAVAFNDAKLEWKVTDPDLQADVDLLRQAHPGIFFVVDRAEDDSRWLVVYARPDASPAEYLYGRPRKKLELLFVDQPELDKYKLADMEPVTVKSRDGFDLLCYLTVPPGVERKKLPLVLLPHGGPWWRDRWGFDPWVQLLANRGYAVVQPEYRGSTGFGKKFLNASTKQYGDRAIMGDYLDVIKWAVDSGLADANRLAVMGGSGGGYATLCCIAFHPEVGWKCAVDLVGPSCLRTLQQSIPAYWKPVKKRWLLRMGDAETDDAFNREMSPLYRAGDIKAPLLIGQGQNDPRVNIREAEQITKAMRDKGLPVTLVVYPDEGHGFARPENNIDFYGRMEEFLAKYLSGRKEPWKKVPGATGEVR